MTGVLDHSSDPEGGPEDLQRYLDASSTLESSRAQVEVLERSESVESFNHVPGGANVLYMDGHVEFHKIVEGVYPCGTDQFSENSLAGAPGGAGQAPNRWANYLSYIGGLG